MKIYTKTGDQGETGLFGGKRVPKNYVRIEACGAIDEANAFLGLAMTAVQQASYRSELALIQGKLFDVGTVLANPLPVVSHITDNDIEMLEVSIDRMTATLPELRNFILPGGNEAAALLHVSRSVVRQAERRVVTVSQHQEVPPVVIRYLNRLSDYLFTLARVVNHEGGTPEIAWKQGS